ncbi:MAG: histidine triad nucleotide-binding protein [Chloroflexi bacterium]|nr:histidine triad nucleotide-binding protein [Chloroflexota bacterium]
MAQQCIFCRIVAGELPSDILYQDDKSVVIRDIHPVAPTHLLIVPRVHIPTLNHVSPEDAPLLGHLLVVARHMAREAGLTGEPGDEKGYRVVLNCGRGGGQAVFHLHLHLIGGRPLRGIG